MQEMPNEIFIIIKTGHSVIHTRKKLNILIVNIIGILQNYVKNQRNKILNRP